MNHCVKSPGPTGWGTLLIASLLLSGCGGSDDPWVKQRKPVHPVSGRITLEGAPVEGAIVMFRSTTEELTAHGTTDSNGDYQLTTYETNDGAVTGEHVVTVRKTEKVTVPSAASTEDEPSSISYNEDLLDTEAAYPHSSQLRAQVSDGGVENVNFEF